MPINYLLERLKNISSNGLIRRQTEKKSIETVLKLQQEVGHKIKVDNVLPNMAKRILYLEENPLSAGNDEGKKLPTSLKSK